jgi:hypothetical protein
MSDLIDRLSTIYKDLPELEGERGQTGLVKASKASKSVVNQWLNGGIKSMDIRYALEIERTLGYSHIWLMTGIGERKAAGGVVFITQEAAEVRHTQWIGEDEAKLLDLFRGTDDGGRKAMLSHAEILPKTPILRPARNKA